MMKSKDLYVVHNWDLDMFRVSPDVITTCVDLAASGSRDYSPVPHLSGEDVTRIAAEALDAERVMREWDGNPIDKAPDAGDLALAVLAKEHERRAQERGEFRPGATKTIWTAGCLTLLKELLVSPNLDLSLDYGKIYDDAAWMLIRRGEPRGLDYLHQNVAHAVQYDEEDISNYLLRFAYLAILLPAPHRDVGISLFAALLRLRPADMWIYNYIALASDTSELAPIGLAALNRGEALVSEQGDKEGFAEEFAELREELLEIRNQKKDDSISPEDWSDLARALQTPFDQPEQIIDADIVYQLVPEARTAKIKRPPSTIPEPDCSILEASAPIKLKSRSRPEGRSSNAAKKKKNKRKAQQNARKRNRRQ